MNYYNKTILLVEDEAINAKLNKRSLEKYKFEVIHAKTGEEAVNIVQSASKIDLVLMDIDLGDGIDGTEAAEIILLTNDLPLVFLSSHTEPEIVKKTEGITSYGYIVKNSGETVLIASVKMAFRLFDAKKKEEDKEKKLRDGEEKYRSIFENTGTCMFIVENDMTISMVNNQFIRSFGYLKDEMIGKMKWTEIAHPDNLEFMIGQHRLRRENESRASQSYETKFKTNSGEVRYATLTICMIPGTDQSIASVTDITEQKKAEEEINNKNEELAAMNEEFEATNEALIETISRLEERENEYRMLFESSSSGIFIISEGKLNTFNHAVAEVSGYSEEQMLSKPLISFIHPDDAAMASDHYKGIIKNRKTEISSPLRIITSYNKIKWIGLKSCFILWHGKKATLNFISDITERKEAEEALKAAEETYRDLFINSQVGIFRTDIDTGFIIEANDCFARLFGFNGRDDLLSGNRCIDGWYFDPDIRKEIIGLLKEHGELNNYEVLFKRQDSSLIWLRFSARIEPVKGWLQGLMEDITEQKRAESKLSKRLTIENVLSRISLMASTAEDLDHFINMSLSILGETMNLSRSYIFKYNYETDVLCNTYEWCAPDIWPQRDNLQSVAADHISCSVNQLRSGYNICFSEIESMQEESIRNLLKSRNVLSVLLIPLFIRGNYYGFIGFDDCIMHHFWIEEDVDLLTSVSRIIAGFIEIKQYEENLKKSENKYKKIFQNIQSVFYRTDLYGVLTELSPSIESNLGFTREELIGKHMESVYIDPSERILFLDNLCENGKVIDYELRLKNKDGRLRYFITNSHFVFDSHGKPSGVEGMMHDISKRKKIEEQLNKKTKYLDGIIKGTNAGTWEWNIQTGVTVFNDRWAEIIGYTLEEISPVSIKTWISHIHPDDLRISNGLLKRHFQGELDYYELELRMKHKNGYWVWVLDRGKIINWTADGNPLLMMGTHQDITERKEAEEKINQVNKSKSMYLAKLSHEIRTPMSGISGMIDLAITADTDLERLDYLNTAKQSSSHLVSIINDVLDFSKVESGSLILESVPFSPVQEIRTAISIFSYMCSTKGLYLNFNIRNISEKESVQGDPTRFRQVIINIVGNAVKFSENGGIDVSVERLEDSNIDNSLKIIELQISIQDTGPGIRSDKLETIFMNFGQADPEISRKYGGTGLGLAISKELIELMGGSIHVQSEIGKGSLFILKVPFQLSEVKDEIKRSLLTPDRSLKIEKMKYSILVAEDDLVNRKLISALLKKNGHSVAVAENGKEAIERLLKQSFDLILLDIEMPVMNGVEVAQRIRAGEAGEEAAGIPIIALTAHVSDNIIETCYNAGMNSYLSKPVKIEVLNPLMSDLIESARYGQVML